MKIIFSSCWYVFKTKFDKSVYLSWIDNMLSNVNNYKLVIYSDLQSSECLHKYLKNANIKLVIKPFEEFYNYKYKNKWISNHEINHLLNNSVDWRVNALWSEKIWFVDQTRREKYFCEDDTLDENDVFYGWCDIGYFRNRKNDVPMHFLQQWPNQEKIASMDRTKIHYSCVNNNHNFLGFLHTNTNTNYSYLYTKHTDNPPVFINSLANNQVNIRIQDNTGTLYTDSAGTALNHYVLVLHLKLIKESNKVSNLVTKIF